MEKLKRKRCRRVCKGNTCECSTTAATEEKADPGYRAVAHVQNDRIREGKPRKLRDVFWEVPAAAAS